MASYQTIRLRGPDSMPFLARLSFAAALALILTTLLPANVEAKRPATRAPSALEREWISRLSSQLRSNSSAMPIPVVNTLESLERTLAWGFDCPKGARLKRVEMLVSTEHIAWDPRLAGRHGSAGTYYWGVKLFSLSGVATVTADNWVMLNPVTLEYEASKADGGTVLNEGLLYHELLHGELLILAMATPSWQRSACNLDLDLERNDGDHSDIDPAVDIYLENRSRLLRNAAAD